MTARQSLHTGSAAHAVLAAQDARLDLAGLLALNGPTPLDVRQGILYAPGSPLNVTGDSSTSPWRYTVAAGSAVMSKGNADGPHVMTNDGTVLVSTTVPPGSNSRYDLIYIVQQDIDATISPDGSTAAVIGVVNGAPGASPAVPALPAGAIALATALVASTATTGTSGAGVTISNLVSRFTTTRGNPVPVRSSAERAELTAYDGLQVYRLDTHVVETYQAGAVNGWAVPPGTCMGTPTANAANGTATSGATETRDAVLGDYVFTAIAGHRYRAIIDGVTAAGTVTNDYVQIKIRNGGASTPTSASTLLATSGKTQDSTGLGFQMPISGTFVPGAGTVTLSMFTVRLVGTGVVTPAGPRELYVVDLGLA